MFGSKFMGGLTMENAGKSEEIALQNSNMKDHYGLRRLSLKLKSWVPKS